MIVEILNRKHAQPILNQSQLSICHNSQFFLIRKPLQYFLKTLIEAPNLLSPILFKRFSISQFIFQHQALHTLSMSLSLTDQQVLQIVKHLYKTMEKEQSQKLIDLDHLDTFKRKQIKPLYPHKTVLQNGVKKLQKHSCGDICFNLSSGSTCCSFFKNIQPPDNVYQQFGLGMNVYFNFMKHFASCLIFLAIFGALAVGLSCFISVSNGLDPIQNYQNFFFSTTMGSFSSGYFRCKYSAANQSQNVSYVATFDLNCPEGEIYQFGPVMTTHSQENLMNCQIERQRFQIQSQGFYLQSSNYTIIHDKTCTTSDCKITVNISSQSSIKLVSYPYSCINPSYDLFANSKPISIRILTFIFVGFDLLITFGLMFFICSEKDGENKQVEHFKKFQLSLKDFSIKVKGFNRQRFDQEFHEFVGSISQRERDFLQKIIQIKVPDDEKYLQEVAKRRQRYQQLFRFMERNFFDSMIDPRQYSSSEQFIENTFASSENYLSFKKELTALVQGYNKVGEGDRTISEEISIYLVLNGSADVSLLKGMRQSFCCGKYLVTKSGKQFQLEEAPIPDMLQWMNKTKWTVVRIFLSWVLTLAIVVGSYLLFGFVQWKEKNLLSNYQFAIDCAVLYPNATFTQFTQNLYDKNSTQYTQCYCSSNYFSLNITDQVSTHCSQWWHSYLLYFLIPLIISLGLVLYNLMVSIVFKKLSEFESHFFVTEEMFSYIIKRSFILVMNMGLIIVLLNFNYFKNSSSLSPRELLFLFEGEYSDMTSDWYLRIGSIIVLTMIFNISYPFMQLVMTSGLKCLRKCVDKRCWSRRTTQKYKMDYINLYSSDVYPIQERYAIVVSIFWIVMIFGCVMPALYIIVALSIFLLVIVDKVLLFKFFKTPINFDQSLHHKVIKTLYLGLMAHLVTSAFFLSEPNLIPNNTSFTQFSSLTTTSNQRLNTIIQTYYIIPYVGLFILMLLYAIFKQTVLQLLSKFNKKTIRTSLYKIKTLSNFYDSLTQYQLVKLKVMVQKEVCRLTTLKRQKSFASINLPTEYSQICINTSSNQKLQNFQQIDTQLTIYTKTLKNIVKTIENHQEGKVFNTTKLIGMPGYQMLLNEIQAEKDKKMLQLDSVLEQIIVRKR